MTEKQKYAIEVLKDIKGHYQLQAHGFQMSLDMAIKALEQEPTALFEQVRWECDVAISQLHELGYKFGEKIEQQPCDDAISRQAAIDAMATWDWQELYLPIHFKQLLEDLPSVSTEKTGHWKRIKMDKYSKHSKYWYRCDRCGKGNLLGNTDWCPNCGAKMKVKV